MLEAAVLRGCQGEGMMAPFHCAGREMKARGYNRVTPVAFYT